MYDQVSLADLAELAGVALAALTLLGLPAWLVLICVRPHVLLDAESCDDADADADGGRS